jgi:hypothetical protein
MHLVLLMPGFNPLLQVLELFYSMFFVYVIFTQLVIPKKNLVEKDS